MTKEKKDYVAPFTEITQIEIESAICSGSAQIDATAPGSSIAPQEVNTEFLETNDFGASSDWDNLQS